jgi:hypothetical protein
MDVPTKTSSKRAFTRDNFLADAVRPKPKHITYADGFRLGVGFLTGIILVTTILAGLTWALIVAFKIHA